MRFRPTGAFSHRLAKAAGMAHERQHSSSVRRGSLSPRPGRLPANPLLPGWPLLLMAGILLALAPAPVAAQTGPVEMAPLGFQPLPEEYAQRFCQPVGNQAERDLPTFLDWRERGIVTRAKSQQTCGACWAFAGIACIESMCILAGADSRLDLSEQQAISCDVQFRSQYGARNDGCCGGTVTIFEYFRENYAILESAFPYGNGDFDGEHARSCDVTPSWDTVPCPASLPEPTGWRVESWTLIAPQPIPTVDALKRALQQGPVWLGYRVYEDFVDYWYYDRDPSPYRHVDGAYLGGHAVLLIGYDDARQCWIAKNSWGTTGPFRDGTFLVAYDGNCDFGINAASVVVAPAQTPTRTATLGSIRWLFR